MLPGLCHVTLFIFELVVFHFQLFIPWWFLPLCATRALSCYFIYFKLVVFHFQLFIPWWFLPLCATRVVILVSLIGGLPLFLYFVCSLPVFTTLSHQGQFLSMIHPGHYLLGVLKYKAACSVNLECLSVAELIAVFECDWACRCGDFSGGICVIDAHFAGANEDCGNQQCTSGFCDLAGDSCVGGIRDDFLGCAPASHGRAFVICVTGWVSAGCYSK